MVAIREHCEIEPRDVEVEIEMTAREKRSAPTTLVAGNALKLPAGGGRPPVASCSDQPSWVPICPVPSDAPPPPGAHYKLGKPTSRWEYRGSNGELLALVCRFEEADGGKIVLPLSYCHRNGVLEWRWKALVPPRALYGRDRLAAHPDAPVIVVEGEKAADAAGVMFSDHVSVTSSGGSKAASKADWSTLCGRKVTIWPDADGPGMVYAADVAKHACRAGAVIVGIVDTRSLAESFDAADALAEGWGPDRANEFIDNVLPSTDLGETQRPDDDVDRTSADGLGDEAEKSGGASKSKRKRTPQRDLLMGFLDSCELWHDANGEAYATFPVNGHLENGAVRQREFRRWMLRQFYMEQRAIAGGQAMEDALRLVESRAVHDGLQYATWRRVGFTKTSVYLDLCDKAWRACEVKVDGWQVVASPPVKFLRSPHMRPLPEPEAGHLIEELREFVPVATDDDFKLVVAWLVAALRGRGPYPVLVVNGEQGSGKSGLTRLLRLLVDPNEALIRSCPRDDRDLIVSAVNTHVLAFDNLSRVAPWLSDALCRIATGSGFATRKLHTDREEEVFAAARPVMLNGIPNLADRSDLADRAITLQLPAIAEEERRPEEEIDAEAGAALPRILGALLDAVSSGLCHLPETRLARAPRMADFARWVTACSQGLGWDPDEFLEVYERNREEIFHTALEADPLAVAIRELVNVDHSNGWEGKPGELLDELNRRVPDKMKNRRSWPQSASALGSRIRGSAPLLRRAGFEVTFGHSGERFIRIVPIREQQ